MSLIGGNTKAQIRSIVERVENLEQQKSEISSDIRDVYAEARSNGFDVKALRAIVRLRKEDADERRAREAVLETYMLALGMLSDLPLGEAAIRRAGLDPAQMDISERDDLPPAVAREHQNTANRPF